MLKKTSKSQRKVPTFWGILKNTPKSAVTKMIQQNKLSAVQSLKIYIFQQDTGHH